MTVNGNRPASGRHCVPRPADHRKPITVNRALPGARSYGFVTFTVGVLTSVFFVPPVVKARPRAQIPENTPGSFGCDPVLT